MTMHKTERFAYLHDSDVTDGQNAHNHYLRVVTMLQCLGGGVQWLVEDLPNGIRVKICSTKDFAAIEDVLDALCNVRTGEHGSEWFFDSLGTAVYEKKLLTGWTNYGDADHREVYGHFVKPVGSDFKVVITNNLEDAGFPPEYIAEHGKYSVYSSEVSVRDIQDAIRKNDVGACFDWKSQNLLAAQRAVDIVLYYGHGCEWVEHGNNYSKLLSGEGVYGV